MKSKEEIIDMFTKVSDCCGNEDECCPFFHECECNDHACKENWTKWIGAEQ